MTSLPATAAEIRRLNEICAAWWREYQERKAR
jgi:hypothetical protein